MNYYKYLVIDADVIRPCLALTWFQKSWTWILLFHPRTLSLSLSAVPTCCCLTHSISLHYFVLLSTRTNWVPSRVNREAAERSRKYRSFPLLVMNAAEAKTKLYLNNINSGVYHRRGRSTLVSEIMKPEFKKWKESLLYSVCPRPSLVNGLYCTGAKVLHFTIIVNRTNVLQVLFFCIFLFSMVLCFNTRPEKQLFLARSFFFLPSWTSLSPGTCTSNILLVPSKSRLWV